MAEFLINIFNYMDGFSIFNFMLTNSQENKLDEKVENINSVNILNFISEITGSSEISESTETLSTNNVEKKIIGGAVMVSGIEDIIPNKISEECSLTKVLKTIDNSSASTNSVSGSGSENSDETCNVCLTKQSLDIVKSEVEKQKGIELPAEPEKLIEAVKEEIGAKTQREIVKKVLEPVDPTLAKKEIKENFKRLGNTDVSLLSNFDIDGTLQQWRDTMFPDFYAYDFNMIDYMETGGSLATVNMAELYKQGKKIAGCVINSDRSVGTGLHWMALLVDMRDPQKATIEFFNSSGNMPERPWKLWMLKTQKELESVGVKSEIVVANKRLIQNSRTECGPMSLMYIFQRLNGVKISDIKITDELMFEFRQHLFYDPKRPPMRQFNYENYKKITNIKWE